MPGVAGLAIAGLWYVLLGLAAPLVAWTRSGRGEDPRWPLAWRSFGLAWGMIAAFLATTWLIALAAGPADGQAAQSLGLPSGGVTSGWEWVVRVGGFIAAILLAVLLVVQITVRAQRRSNARADS